MDYNSGLKLGDEGFNTYGVADVACVVVHGGKSVGGGIAGDD